MIKKLCLKTASICGSLIPLQKLMSAGCPSLILPFYHIVSDNPPSHIKHLYTCKSLHQFESDLEFLLNNFEPLSLQDLIRINAKKSKPGFFLSFDDGLSEFYDNILPLLVKKGIPAACFLNTDFIDNKDLFFRYKASLLLDTFKNQKINLHEPVILAWLNHFQSNMTVVKAILSVGYKNKNLLDELAKLINLDFDNYLQTNKPYMTSEQIKSLKDQGFYIGSHSIDHPKYSEIPFSDQINQTEISVETVKSKFETEYSIFSFPFTDFGVQKRLFTHLHTGTNKLTASFGSAGLKNETIKNHFQRIPMEVQQYSGEAIIKGEYLYYLLKSMVNKNTINRNV